MAGFGNYDQDYFHGGGPALSTRKKSKICNCDTVLAIASVLCIVLATSLMAVIFTSLKDLDLNSQPDSDG